MEAREVAVAGRLRAAGFVAAEEEAALLVAAGGDLDALVARRLTGEPLAWLLGGTTFYGHRVRIDPGVYVPRPHSEALARRAVALLPADGVAVDLCTGSGAVALALAAERPGARVVGVDLDAAAVACARANGVEAYEGDLFAAVPPDLAGRVDVVVGVLPYVPTERLPLLQRDTLAHEAARSYDGGPDGLALVRRAVAEARRWLRPGGWLVLEVGGDQAGAIAPDLAAAGFEAAQVLHDADGDPRGIATRRG